MLKRSFYLLLILSLLLGMGCIRKNAEGRQAPKFLPKAFIQMQASSAYRDQKKQVPISKNSKWKKITQRVADRLIIKARERYGDYCKGFTWEVQLFDQPKTVNAYCMPGGKIGIYTGILPICKNEAGLAAVMGHEIAHALLEHGNERISGQLGVSSLLMVGQLMMARKSGLDQKVQKQIMGLAGAGAQMGFVLPFSRKHETEADRMGLRLMAMAGYSPSEAPNLWRRMKAQGGKKPPLILSTHPSDDQRIQALEAMQGEVAPLYSASSRKYGLGENF